MTDTYRKYTEFNLGRAISRTFGTVWNNLPVFGLTTILVLFVFGVITFGLDMVFGLTTLVPGARPGPAGMAPVLLNLVLLPIQLGFVVSMLVDGGVAAMNGAKPRFAALLAAGLRNALPVAGILVVAFIAIYVASLLFVVPGVILSLCWAAIIPAQVIEKKGFGVFGRSLDLTRNHRGAIFGFSLVMGVINIIIVIVGFALAAALFGIFGAHADPAASFSPASAGSMAVGVLAYFAAYVLVVILASVAPASVYVELAGLRGDKSTAKVFE